MDLPRVLVLAGGLGTRLRPLTESLPKVLVPVRGRPFIDYLLEELARQGARRFVLSVGHLAGAVEAHLGDGGRLGCEVRYAREDAPLGTGGAIRDALPLLEETFVVANGDTLLELELDALLERHRREAAPATLAVVRVPDRGRYGAVHVEEGRVVRFDEKRVGAGPGLINGGVCVLSRSAFAGEAPDGPFSLERDLLPRWLGRIAAHETDGFFVDMGTHEALQELERSIELFVDRRG